MIHSSHRKIVACALFLLMFCTALNSGLARAEPRGDAQGSAPNSLSWQMLPGDSVNRLAALFYPRNAYMQQRFVAKTLELNRKQGLKLNSASTFDENSTIIIPDLKSLSMQARPIKRKHVVPEKIDATIHPSQQPAVVGDQDFLSKLQLEYEGLVRQNSALKQELDRLNAHLASLQKSLQEMFVQAKQMLVQKPAVVTEPEPIVQEELVQQKPAVNPLQPVNVQRQQEPPKQMMNMQLAEPQRNNVAAVPDSSSWDWRALLSFKQQDALLPLLLTLVAVLTLILLVLSWGLSWYHSRKPQQQVLTETVDTDFPDIIMLPEVSAGFEDVPELVMERARQMVSNDQADEAVSVLEIYIRERPTQSVYPWLYLLEIYHNLRKKEEFDELVERLHATFNVKPPAWEDTQSGVVVESSLEDFPHIVTELERIWTSDDAVQYLSELQLDNRRGERTGFSLEVLKEITVLQKILETRGQYAAGSDQKQLQ